ncbi:hypothetical protein, partial [Tabrizicola fusiformis]|uniref:hypothetical protein n=1 Tax=Tabrizicola sp. SY72 TaxID=2741673 RepID=UPI0019D531AE
LPDIIQARSRRSGKNWEGAAQETLTLPFGGAAMKSVNTPPVAMAKPVPMSDSVGAPVPSLATSCQRVWVPRWNPMPMQLMSPVRNPRHY